MKKRRVAFVTQWFAPEPSAQPVRIARMLRDAGHTVTVLTGVPNYPTGRVHDGYRASSPSVETFEGMTVRRTPLYPSHDQSTLRRLANYASWSLSSALWGRRVLRRQDVVLVYSSPGTAALAAMAAKRLHGVPYVLLIQDVWPDSVFASGFLTGRPKKIIESILSVFVNRAYADASRIAVISPGMKTLLQSRGVPLEKMALVYNSPIDMPRSDSMPRKQRGDVGLSEADFVLMYAGNHGTAQGLGALIDAMKILAPAAHIKLVMVGDGVAKPELERTSSEAGLENVRFLAAVPRSELETLSALADVQVVALADEPLFSVTMPSKVQSILARAQPMLAIARGDVADVVERAGCGASARPGDPHQIAQAISTLANRSPEQLRTMGHAGRRVFDEEMAAQVNDQRLLELVAESAHERGDSPRRIRS